MKTFQKKRLKFVLKIVKIIRRYRIILSADTASEVRQPLERCLSRKAGIMRYRLKVEVSAKRGFGLFV